MDPLTSNLLVCSLDLSENSADLVMDCVEAEGTKFGAPVLVVDWRESC